MNRLLVVVTCLVVFPAVAAADKAKPKAHLECMSGEPIKSGKAARLTGELWCTIKIDKLGGFKVEGLVGNLTVNPGPKTTLKTMPGGQEIKVVDTQDGVVAQLDNPWVADKEYKVCEPFTVAASLSDAENRGMDDEVWSQVFKVAASCPKPKPVKGLLRCHYTAQDNTVFNWPGNGAKVKPRLEGPLSCGIAGGKPEKGVTYEPSVAIQGKGTPATGRWELEQEGNGFFDAEFGADTYETCSNFTVVAAVKASGATLWSGKLAIKQDCPD